MTDNLLGIAPSYVPDDPGPREKLAAGTAPSKVAAAYPASSLPWAMLAEESLAAGRFVEGYAYARTGYHRGLDSLRRAGWRGQGPVPWSHEPNQGFLRALSALGRAAAAIGETAEETRINDFLRDSDPSAPAAIASLVEGPPPAAQGD